jgi:hypothetical protein
MAMVRTKRKSMRSGRNWLGGRTTVRCVRTLRARLRISSLAPASTTGWVAMSKRRKLRFSVRRMPLSTRPLARRSRTCLSW